MKRRKERRVSAAERRWLLFVTAFLLAAITMGVWIQLSQHEIVPPKDIVVPSGEDLRVPLVDLSPGKAWIYRIEGEKGALVRVFVKRQDHGRMVVTFAACRRCDSVTHPSHLSNGQLICGHCGEPMPLLEEGAALPVERDCTPVPVPFRIEGDSLVVRAADIESGRPLFAKNSN